MYLISRNLTYILCVCSLYSKTHLYTTFNTILACLSLFSCTIIILIQKYTHNLQHDILYLWQECSISEWIRCHMCLKLHTNLFSLNSDCYSNVLQRKLNDTWQLPYCVDESKMSRECVSVLRDWWQKLTNTCIYVLWYWLYECETEIMC